MPIYNNLNKISVHGVFASEDKFRLLAAMHGAIETRGFRDIVLDFSGCTGAFSAEMLAICSRSLAYWKDGIDLSLVLPTDKRMRRLFLNTGWANLIDFRSYEPSRYRGYTHAAALRFSNGKEQARVVDKMLDILLAAISHFGREEIRYIEWALNEITDNVINHAESSIGGIVQVTNHRQRGQIEFVVCDAGLGIPKTLRDADQNLRSDTEALDVAIREGVTRDRALGQGNGLFGTWSICQKSGGSFSIFSGNASLTSSQRNGLSISNQNVPLNGALVVSRIGYDDAFDLSNALVFSGRPHVPVDYIESHFEEDERGNIHFSLKDESDGFGSRSAGEPVRRKLVNVVGCLEEGRAIIDFDEVYLVSSSYADEVVGKLFVELGPIEFMKRIEIINIDPLVRDLVDRAIKQRMETGIS